MARSAPMTGPVMIGLSAVVIALREGEAVVLTLRPPPGELPGLPSGPFDPGAHRTFELGLRAFVTTQTGFTLGYVEQLYTFGDEGRDAPRAALGSGAEDARIVSVGYLALAPAAPDPGRSDTRWSRWSRFFPYEDWRHGRPAVIDLTLAPALTRWAGEDPALEPARMARARDLFAIGEGLRWNEERVLERYELLYEAGLAPEAVRDRGEDAGLLGGALGEPMTSDHRRILATGLGRLRGKLKYRPIVFDLMPAEFTLSQLQRTVEAIAGLAMHKQNFRRGLVRAGLIEPTGRYDLGTGGRPAELFRVRPGAADGARAMGLSLPALR